MSTISIWQSLINSHASCLPPPRPCYFSTRWKSKFICITSFI